MNLPSVSLNSIKCLFNCGPRYLRRLTISECLDIHAKKNVFVTYDSRVCVVHGEGENFKIPDNFDSNKAETSLNNNKILLAFVGFKNMILKERETNIFKSFLKMQEKKFIFETGLNASQFQKVLSSLSEELNVRKKEFVLGVYLSRLRRSYTYEELFCRWVIHT